MRLARVTGGLAWALVLAGCDAGLEMHAAAGEDEGPGAVAAESRPGDDVMRKWTQSCALCHVTGNGGAPRVGDTEEWRLRLAQGRQALLTHTVEGFNNMPPLGYCMACERDDLLAMIDFMAGPAAAGPSGVVP
jgi:cytochrome c5